MNWIYEEAESQAFRPQRGLDSVTGVLDGENERERFKVNVYEKLSCFFENADFTLLTTVFLIRIIRVPPS